MKNLDNPKIIGAFLDKLMFQFNVADVPYEDFYGFQEYFIEAFKNLPDSLKESFNEKMNFVTHKCVEVTVEVTTKRKAKIIVTKNNYHDKDEWLGKIVEFTPSIKEKVKYKQILSGRIWVDIPDGEEWKECKRNEGKVEVVDNIKPSTFCCGGMQDQFRFCEQDGLSCPDNFITHKLNGDYIVEAPNATYMITNCPFCGKLLSKKNHGTNHRVLLLGD